MGRVLTNGKTDSHGGTPLAGTNGCGNSNSCPERLKLGRGNAVRFGTPESLRIGTRANKATSLFENYREGADFG